MKNKPILKVSLLLLTSLIIFLFLFCFTNIVFAENKENKTSENKRIHGVIPTKVTAHLNSSWKDAAGNIAVNDWYFEFWNVGKLGGSEYEYTKLTIISNKYGGPPSQVWEGYFTGGPNGTIYVSSEGVDMNFKLQNGKTIDCGGWGIANIDNPQAFEGWVNFEFEEELIEPTIKLILLNDPIDVGNNLVKYTIKALVSGNPEPTVEFFRNPQSSISNTDNKNVITVIAGKNEALELTATATNSVGSATAVLGFPPPLIELFIKEGPIQNQDKSETFFIGAKVIGTPEPSVEFSTNEPSKITVIDNLNLQVILNPGESVVIEAIAKNEFGQADSKILVTAQKRTAPTIQLKILSGPKDSGLGLYSYIIEAIVDGYPEPTVEFNRDDSGDSSGKNKVTIKLAENEEFTLTAKAKNTEGEVKASILLPAPSKPKINLKIVKGPHWVNSSIAYYVIEAVVEGYPEPRVVWEKINEAILGVVGKNKKIVYVRENKTGQHNNVIVSAYAVNEVGKSNNGSLTLNWSEPPEGYFNKRMLTKIEGYGKGKLQIKKANEKYFSQVVGILTVEPGDTIKTIDNSLIILPNFINLALLDKGTKLYVIADETGYQFIVDKGKLVMDKPKGNNISIQGNHGMANVKGTKFVFSSDDNETSLKVIDGSVEFISSLTEESIIVNSGQSIKATKNGIEEISFFDITSENNYWKNFEAVISENKGVLVLLGNFITNIQNRLYITGISESIAIIVGILIIVVIIIIIVIPIIYARKKVRN